MNKPRVMTRTKLERWPYILHKYRLFGDINILKYWVYQWKQNGLYKYVPEEVLSRIEEGEIWDPEQGVNPWILFEWIYRRIPRKGELEAVQFYKIPLDVPKPFLKNCSTLLAFHEWLEWGQPYEESGEYYVWYIILNNKRRKVACKSKYFKRETDDEDCFLKEEIFKPWMIKTNKTL